MRCCCPLFPRQAYRQSLEAYAPKWATSGACKVTVELLAPGARSGPAEADWRRSSDVELDAGTNKPKSGRCCVNASGPSPASVPVSSM